MKKHDVGYRIELLEKQKVDVPEEVQNARWLTAYAVETPYPGDYEPVDERDYTAAVEAAEKVLRWVEKTMRIKA